MDLEQLRSATPRGLAGLHRLAGQIPGFGPGERGQVFFGPEGKWPEAEFIAVGLGPLQPDTRSTQTAVGPESTEQEADVTCLIRGWSNDNDPAFRVVRAFEVFEALQTLLAADRTMAGLVDGAEVVDATYLPSPSARGLLADLIFTVRVQIF
jgi:hypothetical protein